MDKTRDLSIYEFCEVLQIEYLCAELRSKIYPHTSDKKFYKERVMAGKKDKINDIVERNGGFATIFTNDKIKEALTKKLIPPFGFPNFVYKDEKDKEDFGLKDFSHYYMLGSDFIVKIGREKIPCTLISVDRKNWKATVKIRFTEEKKEVSLNEISRVL